mmetsp:Transcript_9402/g.18331  ORF Transcript_9402/g.18331 Transcript_9402/m.18331 type:complete len:118 (+) Transcript_9402:527-880(+)
MTPCDALTQAIFRWLRTNFGFHGNEGGREEEKETVNLDGCLRSLLLSLSELFPQGLDRDATEAIVSQMKQETDPHKLICITEALMPHSMNATIYLAAKLREWIANEPAVVEGGEVRS